VGHRLGLATRTQISVCKSPFHSAGMSLMLVYVHHHFYHLQLLFFSLHAQNLPFSQVIPIILEDMPGTRLVNAGWQFSLVVVVGLDQRSYSTLGPVTAWMGDCRRSGGQTISVCNQPPSLTQPGHSSMGRRIEYQVRLGR